MKKLTILMIVIYCFIYSIQSKACIPPPSPCPCPSYSPTPTPEPTADLTNIL